MQLLYTFLLFFYLHYGYCDWVSEWLEPVQQQYKTEESTFSKGNEDKLFQVDDKYFPQFHVKDASNSMPLQFLSTVETTLEKAKILTEAIRKEILVENERELLIKDSIAHGRSGVTVATVSTIEKPPRSYIIRNGSWTKCNGDILYPSYKTSSGWRMNLPRCSGSETTSKHDSCVFNSIIKYQTIPATRRSHYEEDDYLCQKTGFNYTFEEYVSVPQSIVKETCKNDMPRKLSDTLNDCGPRIVAEYKFYPYSQTTLPDYCTDSTACVLTVTWHLSNTSIENLDFFKIDPKFKRYFLNPDQDVIM